MRNADDVKQYFEDHDIQNLVTQGLIHIAAQLPEDPIIALSDYLRDVSNKRTGRDAQYIEEARGSTPNTQSAQNTSSKSTKLFFCEKF